jgi:hypothetical protein
MFRFLLLGSVLVACHTPTAPSSCARSYTATTDTVRIELTRGCVDTIVVTFGGAQ